MNKQWMVRLGRILALSAVVVAVHGAALAQAIQPALDRPTLSLLVKPPERVALLGAAKAGTKLVAIGERDVIVYSDDQEKRWRQSFVPINVGLTEEHFVGDRLCWDVKHDAVVLATLKGGQTWVKQFDGVAPFSSHSTPPLSAGNHVCRQKFFSFPLQQETSHEYRF